MSSRDKELYKRAKQRIPGATQLLSKRPESFAPGQWPAYFEEADGTQITTVDGDRFVDMSTMALGSAILGYADPDVDEAVRQVIADGTMTSLNAPEEVELAEHLVDLHPWADMVRYARTGGEAMAIAIRIARAYSGREKVAFCGYHGWHDWYLAANLAEDDALDGHLLPGLEPRGVPRSLQGTAFPFEYNAVDAFERLVEEHGDELGAVAMEPVRNYEPQAGFLETVRERTRELGIPLIVDEVSAGFRISRGGAHLEYGLEPDVAVFAKGLGNGYPIAVVIGNDEVMDATRGCFISSTFWTDRIGPVAALATLRKHRTENVHQELQRLGTKVQRGWEDQADEAGLGIDVTGIPPLSHFHLEVEEAQAAHTLFTQRMLQEDYLAGTSFYPSFAHTDGQVEGYLDVVGDIFREIQEAVQDGDLRGRLDDEPKQTLPPRMT